MGKWSSAKGCRWGRRPRRGWAEERRRSGLAGGGGGGAAERSTPHSHGRSSRQGSALAEATATRSVSAGGAGWRAGDRRVRPSPRSPRGATRPGRHVLPRVTFENLGTGYRSARRPGRRCLPSLAKQANGRARRDRLLFLCLICGLGK